MKSKKLFAFTLIELLVVIAIVGILSGFVLVSLNSATDSAKDVKTKNDLAAISRAILTYHALNNAYPIEETPCSIGDGTCLNELVPNHIQSFPLDFNNTRYQYSSDGTSYTLTGNLTNERVLTYSSETGFSESDAEQGLPGYAKRQPITINSASALTDYQVKLTIAYDSDMQPDFDDLRFASSDGTTELSYWLESKTDSTTATIWVKIPSLASGDNTIYMYYANASATTASNGDNTFEFFDDFSGASISTTKWTITGSPIISSGIANLNNNQGIREKTAIATPAIFEVKYQKPSCYRNRTYSLPFASGVTGFGDYDPSLYWAGWTGFTLSNNTWYLFRHIYDGTNFYWKINNYGGSEIFSRNGVYSGSTAYLEYGSTESDSSQMRIDFVVARKYTTTEPTSSFGAEQNN